MHSRQELYQKIHGLNQQVIKEWVKQAYFRCDSKMQESKLLEELKTIELILHEFISLQDNLYSEALIMTEGVYQGTPRFSNSALQKTTEKSNEPFFNLLQTATYIKKSLGHVMEIENSIVSQYKSCVENKGKNKSLSNQRLLIENELLIEENEKLKRVGKVKGQRSGHEKEFAKMQNELNNYQNLYSELKNAHEELLKEFRNDMEFNNVRTLNEYIIEMQGEKEKLELECKEIARNKANYERDYLETVKKLEQEQGKTGKLQRTLDGLVQDTENKQATIEKAQNFIKKLNDECEKLAKELSKAEDELTLYKKDSRGLEKTWTEAKKKSHEFEQMKKIEERLREENYALKSKFFELTDEKEQEILHLKQALETLIYEKKNLEADMEELEEKLNEIDQMNQERVEIYTNGCERIKELEEILKGKDAEIEKIKAEFKEIEESRTKEEAVWKRQAENLIRNLQGKREPLEDKTQKLQNLSGNNKENAETLKRSGKSLESMKEDVANQLEEALKRENQMKSLINELINKESKFIDDGNKANRKTANDMTRELERWIMRNEEMEQKLFGVLEKCEKLMRNLKDMQKIIEIKEDQLQDQGRIHEELEKKLEFNSDFLKLEIKRLNSMVLREILPISQQTIDSSLHLAHKKIKYLIQDTERKNVEFEENKRKLEKTYANHEILQQELRNLSNKSIQFESELNKIDWVLSQPSEKLLELEGLSEKSEEIIKKIRDLQYYNSKLIESKAEIISLIENKETEKGLLKREFSLSAEAYLQKENLLKEEQSRLLEENNYIKDIALREKDEKVRLKSQLTAESSFFQSQLDHFKQLLNSTESEKRKLEENYQQQRKELLEVLANYDKITLEKRILQNCYEELNDKIWVKSEKDSDRSYSSTQSFFPNKHN